MPTNAKNDLLILWTNADRVTATNMVFMYAGNSLANHWWGNVTLLIWGAPAKLVAENTEIAGEISRLKKAGVRIVACRQCALNLGVVDRLEALGAEVFFTGEFLTDWIKADGRILTV